MNNQLQPVVALLCDFVEDVGPYASELVLVGGLAPFVWRSLVTTAHHEPQLTYDIDFASPRTLALREEATLLQRVEQSGRLCALPVQRHDEHDTRNITWIQRVADGIQRPAPQYVEIVAPLHGSPTDRHGRPKSPVTLQPGLTVDALQYVELLLRSPLRVPLATFDRARAEHVHMQVVNPVSYFVQKLLIRDLRPSSDKRQKDAVYLLECAMMFSGRIESDWLFADATAAERVWLRRAHQRAMADFGSRATDGSVATAAWIRDSGWEPAPTADEVSYWITRFAAEACRS